MIYQRPTPITSTIQTLQKLIDAGIRQPDVRMLAKTMLDSIEAATQYLWNTPALEQADHKRLMQEALSFYADGGTDKGERAKAVFSILAADRAEYWRPYTGVFQEAPEPRPDSPRR